MKFIYFLKVLAQVFNCYIKHYRYKPIATYDSIISLGYNCEVSFQFLRCNHFLDSHLFSWCNVYETKHLLDALNDLDMLGKEFFPCKPMWRDANFGIDYHGRGGMKVWDSTDSMESDKMELLLRVSHLKEKFKNLSNTSDQKVLFVYKFPLHELYKTNQLLSDIVMLRKVLREKYVRSSDLLVLVTEDVYPEISKAMQTIDTQGLILDSIGFHAPFRNVTGPKFDKQGWNSLWIKYQMETNYYKEVLKSLSKKYKFGK